MSIDIQEAKRRLPEAYQSWTPIHLYTSLNIGDILSWTYLNGASIVEAQIKRVAADAILMEGLDYCWFARKICKESEGIPIPQDTTECYKYFEDKYLGVNIYPKNYGQIYIAFRAPPPEIKKSRFYFID